MTGDTVMTETPADGCDWPSCTGSHARDTASMDGCGSATGQGIDAWWRLLSPESRGFVTDIPDRCSGNAHQSSAKDTDSSCMKIFTYYSRGYERREFFRI